MLSEDFMAGLRFGVQAQARWPQLAEVDAEVWEVALGLQRWYQKGQATPIALERFDAGEWWVYAGYAKGDQTLALWCEPKSGD